MRHVLVALGALFATTCAGTTAVAPSRRAEPDDPAARLLHRAETRSGLCGDASYARLELAEAFSWCERVHADSNLHFFCRARSGRAEVVVTIRQDAPPAGGYTVKLRSKGPCWEPPGLGLATLAECGRTLIRKAQAVACSGS